MLTVSIVLAFFSVALGAYLLLTSAEHIRERAQTHRQLSYYDVRAEGRETTKPFYERVLSPMVDRLIKALLRFSPEGAREHYQKLLAAAGDPGGLDADRVGAIKVLLLAGAFIISLLLTFAFHYRVMTELIVVIIFGLVGYLTPDIWLRRIADTRRVAIRRALPDTLDLMVISVEAGLGFDAALGRVVKHGKGPLAREFARVLYEIQVGVARRDAFRNLANRTEVEELRTFSHAIMQADVFGLPIGNVLRTQASEMRTKRRQFAEERAAKTAVKMVFPVVIFIFPAIFVVIIGPAIIRIWVALFGGG